MARLATWPGYPELPRPPDRILDELDRIEAEWRAGRDAGDPWASEEAAVGAYPDAREERH